MTTTSTPPAGSPATRDAIFPQLDAATFREKFNRRPFKVQHSLVGHPLFDLSRLIELARVLPPTQVEYNAGNLAVSQDPTLTPSNGLSVEETIRRIEECQSWMVLKNVEHDAKYRQLLNDCLDEIARCSEPVAPGMFHREGFIFISSARSVTPFHCDPENNFLLQIRGTKRVRMFDRGDWEVASAELVENCLMGAHRNLPFDQRYSDRGEWFDLEPGEGLHFPVVAPHWVENGPRVSISFSVTFQTHESDRQHAMYRLNHKLRSMGLRPRPIGDNPLSDGVKAALIQARRGVKRLLGRSDESEPTSRRY